MFLSKEAKKEPKGTLPKQNRFDSPPVSTDLPSDLTNKWRWNDTVGTTHWNFVIDRLRCSRRQSAGETARKWSG